jgi:hypothetical protein
MSLDHFSERSLKDIGSLTLATGLLQNRLEVDFMREFTFLLLTAVAGIGLTAGAPQAKAQVSVNIGVAPECPYGYYDVAPYACAPAGYYGPEWFNGGVFIGAGPWFHGPEGFHGHVNNHFHPEHGYKGPAPKVGEKPDEAKRVDAAHFKGNEVRDGRGHTVKEKR